EVTAELQDDAEWNTDIWPDGWTDNEDGTATYIVELDDVDCGEAEPVIPTVNGNVCMGGEYTPPTISVEDTKGLTYDIGSVDMETGDYTVTAELDEDYSFPDTMPDGWTNNDDGTATYNGHVGLTPCDSVTPVQP